MEEKFTDKQVREKAVSLGLESLDDAQLLSIIFRDGDNGRSAIELAQSLIKNLDGGLSALNDTDFNKLRSVGGIGLSRAMYIKAALELGKRCGRQGGDQLDTVASSADVIKLFKPQMEGLKHEEFWALYLNGAGRILDKIRISQGGVAQTIVDHRIIVKRAVDKLATSIIVVHNHPSGDPTPSSQDKEITNKLVQAAELFDIKVADHIIITASKCCSMRGEGLL